MEEKSNENKINSLYSLEELVKLGRINKSTYDKVKLGSSIIEKKYLEKLANIIDILDKKQMKIDLKLYPKLVKAALVKLSYVEIKLQMKFLQ